MLSSSLRLVSTTNEQGQALFKGGWDDDEGLPQTSVQSVSAARVGTGLPPRSRSNGSERKSKCRRIRTRTDATTQQATDDVTLSALEKLDRLKIMECLDVMETNGGNVSQHCTCLKKQNSMNPLEGQWQPCAVQGAVLCVARNVDFMPMLYMGGGQTGEVVTRGDKNQFG